MIFTASQCSCPFILIEMPPDYIGRKSFCLRRLQLLVPFFFFWLQYFKWPLENQFSVYKASMMCQCTVFSECFTPEDPERPKSLRFPSRGKRLPPSTQWEQAGISRGRISLTLASEAVLAPTQSEDNLVWPISALAGGCVWAPWRDGALLLDGAQVRATLLPWWEGEGLKGGRCLASKDNSTCIVSLKSFFFIYIKLGNGTCNLFPLNDSDDQDVILFFIYFLLFY